MKTWTENEVALLIEIYPRSTNAELQAMFPNKSPLAIYKKAYKMGFRKMPDIVFCTLQGKACEKDRDEKSLSFCNVGAFIERPRATTGRPYKFVFYGR